MQSFEIKVNEAGQRFDKYLKKLLPGAPTSFIYKMLRKKNIVLNDKKCEGVEKTAVGDVVKLYLSDKTIEEFSAKTPVVAEVALPEPEVLYMDDDCMIVNKPAGVLSQKDESGDYSMVEVITNYLLRNNHISAEELRTFKPAVCNRLDRNTSGILACGISLAGSQALSEVIRNRSVKKEYICFVKGRVTEQMHLSGYLSKNEKNNKVRVFKEKPDADAQYIETWFKVLYSDERYSVLLVDLITGKSHQIRAHLSSINHPILGDNKYGDMMLNKTLKKYGVRSQMLHAYRLTFPQTKVKALDKLSGKSITAPLPGEFYRLLEGENIGWQPGQEEA
ncbi:MAG: RluA family pseudouridine synthase [Lachnospiraceae bacterium]|nr:RluA family pseudouridine synthase [Lachnospiraceae bacterium]